MYFRSWATMEEYIKRFGSCDYSDNQLKTPP